MWLLDSIQRLFKGGTSGFSDFERLVLSNLVSALPSALQSPMLLRIKSVNLVQRLDAGREVNCFVIHKGKPVLPAEMRVNSTTGEKMLASFVVDGAPGSANNGKIWLVDGNLFSLEFDQPTEHAVAGSVTGVHISLVDLSI